MRPFVEPLRQSNIAVLIFADNLLDDACGQILSQLLIDCPNLTRLDLRGARITHHLKSVQAL